MFSFHRPKVYRSSTGCCICKAKSSSSRFTDSKKYEEDFLECFKLATPRQGEICNACVLLVKRWKKLPKGSDRNWRHVVDARAGPGMKSFTKYKVKKAKAKIPSEEKVEKIRRKKHYEREYSPVLSDGDDLDMVDMEFFSEDGPSMGSSRTESPGVSDSDDGLCGKNRRCKRLPKKCIAGPKSCITLDPDYWKKESTCCGTIIRGLAGELMIDPSSLKPCSARLATLACVKLTDEAVYEMEVSSNIEVASNVEVMDMPNPTQVPVILDKAVSKLFSDSSSDSGYEELSNPAMSPTGTIVSHIATAVPHTGTTIPHNGIVSHTGTVLPHSGTVLSHARTVLSYTGAAIPQSYAVKSNIEQVSIVEASYIAPNRIISGH